MNIFENDTKRLRFEDIIWVVFIVLCIGNIVGNENEIKYINSNNKFYKYNADKIFDMVLTITLFIYIYFLIRNYDAYKKVENSKKELYLVKLFGSTFVLVGSICLIYFQKNQSSFVGSPGI